MKFTPVINVLYLDSQIKMTSYSILEDKRTTVCNLITFSGFSITGVEVCASEETFNRELGEQYALAKAKQKLVEHEIYYQRKKFLEDQFNLFLKKEEAEKQTDDKPTVNPPSLINSDFMAKLKQIVKEAAASFPHDKTLVKKTIDSFIREQSPNICDLARVVYENKLRLEEVARSFLKEQETEKQTNDNNTVNTSSIMNSDFMARLDEVIKKVVKNNQHNKMPVKENIDLLNNGLDNVPFLYPNKLDLKRFPLLNDDKIKNIDQSLITFKNPNIDIEATDKQHFINKLKVMFFITLLEKEQENLNTSFDDAVSRAEKIVSANPLPTDPANKEVTSKPNHFEPPSIADYLNSRENNPDFIDFLKALSNNKIGINIEAPTLEEYKECLDKMKIFFEDEPKQGIVDGNVENTEKPKGYYFKEFSSITKKQMSLLLAILALKK
jgi:hypothetical protein